MEKIKLTVFTPTYNRAYILPKCYESLCNQTNKNFIWLIIDDGSTDVTKELVEKWKAENVISIEYIYQENRGKPHAMNTAIQNCQTELIADLDSDDSYLPHTVQLILDNYEKIKNNDKVAGIVGRRQDESGRFIGNQKIPQKDFIINYNQLFRAYGDLGDTNRAYKTHILANCLFPDIPDKFIPECYMWGQVDEKYDLLVINQPFSISEYLEDGYTQNYEKLLKKNPLGVHYSYNQLMVADLGREHNRYTAIKYIIWSWRYGIKQSFKKSKNKKRYLYYLPLCLIYYFLKRPKWIFED